MNAPNHENSLLRSVWWLNPIPAFAIPTILAGFLAYDTDAAAYINLWRTAKHIDFTCYLLMLGIAAAFTLGSLLGGMRRQGVEAPIADWRDLIRWGAVRTVFNICFALAIVAYVIWFGLAVQHGVTPSALLEILRGGGRSMDEVATHLETIPGVTTATQFGITVMTLAVPLAMARGWKTVRWQCGIILTLGLFRAFINSERLAFIELMVPLAVSLLWLRPMSKKLRSLVPVMPPIGLVCLYLLFSVGEYFRSWNAFYATRESNFWEFMGLRLAGYYTTALNNGALLWKASQQPHAVLPMTTLDFLWHFPLIKDLFVILFPSLSFASADMAADRWVDLLDSRGNPEFNNPSGVFGPVVDFGVSAGLLYWLLSGLLCGFLYREFKRRSVSGVFLYPALYISLIESTRILYWATGRFFPDIFVLVVGVLFLFRKPAPPLVSQILREPHSVSVSAEPIS